MNYKTILNEQTTDEQLYTIHQLLKSITGMNPNDYDTYEIKMSYDEWAKHYIVEFCGDSKIQIQVFDNGLCHLRYSTTRGEIYFEQTKQSIRYLKYYDPLIKLIKTYGSCFNNLVHVQTLKPNDIVNGVKIVDITDEYVYYMLPDDKDTYDINDIRMWSYTSNNDRFDALEWGIIIAEPSTVLTVIETNDTLLGLI